MDSIEKRDIDANVTDPANVTAASVAEIIANVSTSSAVVGDCGGTLVTVKSTTMPVTTPVVTRRRKMVNNSEAELTKAADNGKLPSSMMTSDPEDNDRSEVVIAAKSESAETVEAENLVPLESQNAASSPRKRQLKVRNSFDPTPEKKARSSKLEANTSQASALSSAGKYKNSHSVSKTLRRKSKEVSDSGALALSPELKGNQESNIPDTSNCDLTLAENSVVSESKESDDVETPESSKKDDLNPEKTKKVRNPYGRRGKPGRCSTATVRPTMKESKKGSKVSSSAVPLPPNTKVDQSDPDAVKPEWLQPFQEGWRREIVFRNTTADATGARKCDIYYFTPDNSKLRSTPQIVSYLSKQETALTSSCFTFVKRLIYMEPAEFVRNANRRSDVTPSAKLPNPHKQKKETVPGSSEIVLAKPALKLKLKRQKLKKTPSKLKIVLSGGIASGASLPTADGDALEEEEEDPPQFHSTPFSAETERFIYPSPSSLDIDDGSQWKLMKPKKISCKRESSAHPNSTENETELVAEAGEVFTPPEIPTYPVEALVPSSEMQLPVADTNQSETNALLSIVENKDNRKIENKDNQNLEIEDNENKDNQIIENEDNENKDNQNIENEDNENIENKGDQNIENEDDQNNLKSSPTPTSVISVKVLQLSPTPTPVASVKVMNLGNTQTLMKKKPTASRSVAKKSLAKLVKGREVERIRVRMLYKEGLPDRMDRQMTSTPLGQKLNDVARSSITPVALTAGSNTSIGANTKQAMNPPAIKKFYDPFYNPISDIRRCGLHCAGQYGMAPSLHCDICMSMFHPECVGITHVPHRTNFTCQACYALNADFSGSNSFSEKAAPNQHHLTPNQSRSHLNTLHTWSLPPSLPLQQQHSASLGSPLSSSLSAIPSQATSASPGLIQNVSFAGIDRVNPTGRVLSLPSSLASLLNLSRPVTLSIDGQRFSVPGSCFMISADGVKVVLPNNMFMTSSTPNTAVPPPPPNPVPPPASQPTLNADQSYSATALPGGNSTALQKTPSQVSPKANPSERNREMKSSGGEAVRSKDSVECLQRTGQPTDNNQRLSNGETSRLTTETNNGGDIMVDSNKTDRGVEDNSGIGGSSCFSRILSNMELMLLIFEQLNIVDLLKAAQVCTSWRKISEHSSLWKSVNLCGVKVVDWDVASQQLTKHQTKSLDLSRLVHCGSENQTWHQLTAAFSSLSTVRCLVFGPCPPNLIYFAASKMAELESLKAREIVDVGCENSAANNQTPIRSLSTKLDVGKMAVLEKLVHLELRGLNGLVLPAFSFTGGLTELSRLTQLKHLSITSLRDVPGKEFHFLSRLENVEVLEIGDCKLWTKEDYEHLGRLAQLKQLRLECVIDSPETGLGLVLTSLSRLEHLELFSFRISKSSADSLSTMHQLKTLHLYSDTCEEAASSYSYMLAAVKRMMSLTEMTWTILPSDDLQARSSSASQDPQSEKLVPFLLETAELDRDVGKSSAVEWKSITELESLLKEDLASTTVHVVVASAHRTNSS